MNDALYQAMIGAGLREEDVAARLEVDTKTVRRWLEGRLPFYRHRWALAAILHANSDDLWPQPREGRGRPDEVLAVYPHRDDIPAGVWLRVLGSATREICILAETGGFVAGIPGVLDLLRQRAQAGTAVRICLRRPGQSGATGRPGSDSAGGCDVPMAGLSGLLRPGGAVEFRFHQVAHYASMCVADEQLLVMQHAYGIAPGRCPVLHLRRGEEPGLFESYRVSFERIWSDAGAVRRS